MTTVKARRVARAATLAFALISCAAYAPAQDPVRDRPAARTEAPATQSSRADAGQSAQKTRCDQKQAGVKCSRKRPRKPWFF